ARTARAVGVERADDEVLQRHDVDLLLSPALPADEQLRLLEVLAVRGGLHQLGACLAHLSRELEVPEVNLSGAGAAAVRGRPVVAGAPGEVVDVDRARMLLVPRLALYAFDFQKIVVWHGCSLSPDRLTLSPQGARAKRIAPMAPHENRMADDAAFIRPTR